MSVKWSCIKIKGEASIMKTCLFKYIENFATKNEIFSDKNSDIFQISAQNIDCGYSLEPPRRAASKLRVKSPLRKHACSNILKILLPKTENFQTKILIFFIFLLKT